MLTIFSIPKPFRGPIETIQRNAIRSWLCLRPACEVILMGDDDSVASVASELRTQHIPDIDLNQFGTPLVSSAFRKAGTAAKNDVLCYLNADIMLLGDFLPAVLRVLNEVKFSLLIGRRWDLDVHTLIDFSQDWESEVRSHLKSRGRLHGHSGIDYLIFPQGMWSGIPPFAVGRPGWDNWMVYSATLRTIPVIDITAAVTVVHQNHDYSHHPGGQRGVLRGIEALQNLELMGGRQNGFTIRDATYRLTPRGITRNLTLYYFYRRLLARPRFLIESLLTRILKSGHLD